MPLLAVCWSYWGRRSAFERPEHFHDGGSDEGPTVGSAENGRACDRQWLPKSLLDVEVAARPRFLQRTCSRSGQPWSRTHENPRLQACAPTPLGWLGAVSPHEGRAEPEDSLSPPMATSRSRSRRRGRLGGGGEEADDGSDDDEVQEHLDAHDDAGEVALRGDVAKAPVEKTVMVR